MKNGHIVLISFLVLAASCIRPVDSAAEPVLELYGTFQAMGVIVTLTAGEDPDLDAAASVSYRIAGSGEYRQGLSLSRVAAGRFVGSLFRLSPGTAYDVRVSFSDPDGAPLDGATINATGSTRAEITLPAPSQSFHASPAGSGTACSYASPCSLTTALAQAAGGQEIVLRGGIYHQGEMSIPRSGTAGAPIVIRGFPGETAVMEGADPATFTWSGQGGGVYRATVNAGDPHLVTADGQRLYPYQTLADLQGLTWGIPGFYADGTSVYVRLSGDADPNHRTMLVSRFNSAFTIERNFIVIADLTFRNYGRGDYAKALYFNNASDNIVEGCTFAINDLGIGLKRDSHRNVFQDNTFYDTDFDWPWAAVKGGSGLETGGIRMYEPMSGRGTVIRRNTFHDYFDGFGVCPSTTAGVTNETDVYDNLVYNAGDDGMETDGQCSNVRIWRNTFHDVLVGISVAPVYTGPVYAVRNLVYRTGAGNSDYPGSPFKFNSGYDRSGPVYLFHNTADAVLTGNSGLDIKSPGSWSMLYGRNNVWSGTDYALSNANPEQPLDLDFDLLYTTRNGELAWWDGLPDRHLNTLGELRGATGQEQHGINAEPVFSNAAAGNYAPGSYSPLTDQGVVIPGINDDYVGAGPDIGAIEAVATGVTLSADKESPEPLNTPGGVTFTASGEGGSGGYEYEFWLYDGSTWTRARAFSTAQTWSWDTMESGAGNYTVKVKVRSLGSLSESGEAETMMSYRLTPVPGDFDGDGKADITVWRPGGGNWFTIGSADGAGIVTSFGTAGDIPVPADYDGDGRIDMAVFRPSIGAWFIRNSAGGSQSVVSYGADGDVPVPGDYDGIGRAEIAVFRPSTGTWFIRNGTDTTQRVVAYGADGDTPVPADYDGDGRTDVALFRPSGGTWYILNSTDGSRSVVSYGAEGDVPVPGDYDGIGRAETALFRPSTGDWFILNGLVNSQRTVNFGTAGDIPVPGDYDADGKADPAVFRPSAGYWFILQSSSATTRSVAWGVVSDVPL